MKLLKLTLLFAVVLFNTRCSVQRELQVVDGSKADGTLTLATEYDGAFKVKVDVQKAKLKAEEKCKAWGYSNAEFFDAGLTQSIGRGMKRLTFKAQCTD